MSASTAIEILSAEHHPELSGVNRTRIIFFSSVKSSERFFDFFTSNIRNPNTRVAYFQIRQKNLWVSSGSGSLPSE
jgi:hypothetical protein